MYICTATSLLPTCLIFRLDSSINEAPAKESVKVNKFETVSFSKQSLSQDDDIFENQHIPSGLNKLLLIYFIITENKDKIYFAEELNADLREAKNLLALSQEKNEKLLVELASKQEFQMQLQREKQAQVDKLK